MKYLLYILLLMGLLLSSAAIYVTTDKNGHVSYSDIAAPNAKRLDVPAASVIQSKTPVVAAPINAKKPIAKEAEVASDVELLPTYVKKPYSIFAITSPVDQETFQNQRIIPININLVPELQKGDSIQVYVDGKPVGAPSASTQIQVEILERGTHQVYIDLLDAKLGKLKQSNTVTFFVKFASAVPIKKL